MRLTEQQKLFITQRLGCFVGAAETARQVKETYGVTISIQQCIFYDPTTANGAKELSESLKQAFYAARKQFLEQTADIPISYMAYRLRRLQEILDGPGKKNHKLAMDAMKQAAEEVGGSYTNKKEVSGPEGSPIQLTVAGREQATREIAEWRQEQVQALRELDMLTPPAG